MCGTRQARGEAKVVGGSQASAAAQAQKAAVPSKREDNAMIYKRGSVYWAKFQHQGKMVYKSTGQTSATKARQVEARLRSELAMGNFGILTPKSIPTLAEFIKDRFEPWCTGRFPAASKTWHSWYRPGLRSITSFSPLSSRLITEITSEHIDGFAAHLSGKRLQPAS